MTGNFHILYNLSIITILVVIRVALEPCIKVCNKKKINLSKIYNQKIKLYIIDELSFTEMFGPILRRESGQELFNTPPLSFSMPIGNHL